MPAPDSTVLDQIFRAARTFPAYLPDPVSDDMLRELQALAQCGPTAFNAQPGRFVFVRSAEAKARLSACLSPGNVAKVASAPVTVIVAMDSRFHERMAELAPLAPPALAQSMASNPALASATALRSSSLQGAYLIVAARLLGLDCGPMSGFDAAALDAAFFPDGRWRSNFLVNLGHGDRSSLRPQGLRLPFDTVATLA